MSVDTVNLEALRHELEAARVERDLLQTTMLLDAGRASRFRRHVLALADSVPVTLRQHTREQEAFRVKLERLLETLRELSQLLRELPGTVRIASLDESLERLGMLLHLPIITGDELMPLIPLIDAGLTSLRRVCQSLPTGGSVPPPPFIASNTGSVGSDLDLSDRGRPDLGSSNQASSSTGSRSRLDRALQQVTARLSNQFHKELRLETEGLEQLPADWFNTLREVCVELLSNAAEHGIESAAGRHAAGKDRCGRLQLQIYRRPGGFELSMRDDGRGLDVAGIFRSAVELGLWPAGATRADPREASRLVFKPGVTTTDEPTRGKGLRRVLTQLKHMGARIRISSERGSHLRLCADLPHNKALVTTATRARA